MRIGKALRQIRHAGLLLMALSLVSLAPAASMRRPSEGSAEAKAASRYGQLPLSFEENRGQTDSSVRYLSRGTGYTLFLTEKEAILSLSSMKAGKKASTASIRLGFAGSRGAAGVQAADAQPGVSNYFAGSDPSKWLKGLAHYGRINYKSIYPGVDAVFYGNQRQLEYDFVVEPNADARQIRLNFEGAKGLRVNEAGELILSTELGDLVQGRPFAYQTINGVRKQVGAKYQMRGKEVAFTLARYDRSKPLIIDPTLQWSTFLGGTGLDFATGVAVDSANSAYVSGNTASANFPASVRFGGSIGGVADAFVVKYSADGRTILWANFLSGEGNDTANGVAVDDSGVTVVGFTDSTAFPTLNNRQVSYGGAGDAFVAKMTRTGDVLLYSTYVGGTSLDIANDVVLDSLGGAVFVGTSSSGNFLQAGPSNGGADAFAIRIKPDGSDYEFKVLIGSSGAEAGLGVAVDSTNNVFVAGRTNSPFFQGTPGAVQVGLSNASGVTDGFVTKLSPTGGKIWQTLLGGAGNDEAVGIDVDAADNVYVLGNTDSVNYPTTARAFRTTVIGGGDLFVTKLNPTATGRVWSTYFGGTGFDIASKLRVVRASGIPFFTGTTSSADYPLVGQVQSLLGGGSDVFLTELKPDGTGFNNSTYFGGTGTETAGGLAMDAAGNLYIAGTTSSTNLQVLTPNQALLSGSQDAFVTKFSNCSVSLTPILSGTTPGRLHSYVGEVGSITVTGSSDCAWIATTAEPWIVISSASTGAGSGTVTYSVQPNSFGARTGTIIIGNQRFTVQQTAGPVTGAGCVYPLATPFETVGAAGVSKTFEISTSTNNCPYTVSSDVPWVLVGPLSGNSSTVTALIVLPNYSANGRIGTVTVRDLTTTPASTRTMAITQFPSGLTETQRFVTLAYFNLLGRYPVGEEINFHTGQLLAGLNTRANMITSFMASDEFNQSSRFVAGLYLGLLGRDPEFAGWLYQRNALRTGLVTPPVLVTNFLNSAEFQLKYGPLTNEAFVTLLYAQVLGRPASPAEVSGQAALLNAGATNRVAMASSFLLTPEFRMNNFNRTTAFLLYASILGRNPAKVEIDYRTNQLFFTPLLSVVNEFTLSPELTNQTNP